MPELARLPGDARVGGVDAVDVGVDVAALGLERRGEGDGGGVRAAAAERGDPAFGRDALEAGDHRVQPFAELLDQPLGVDRLDAGGAVAGVGAQRHLPALPAARGHAHLLQGQRHQPGGDVLARGDHGVVFARIVEERGLAHPGDELVGLAGHGRDDDGHVVAALDLALDLAGRVADALEVGHAGAAEFHHEPGHRDDPNGRPRMSYGTPVGPQGGRSRPCGGDLASPSARQCSI